MRTRKSRDVLKGSNLAAVHYRFLLCFLIFFAVFYGVFLQENGEKYEKNSCDLRIITEKFFEISYKATNFGKSIEILFYLIYNISERKTLLI